MPNPEHKKIVPTWNELQFMLKILKLPRHNLNGLDHYRREIKLPKRPKKNET